VRRKPSAPTAFRVSPREDTPTTSPNVGEAAANIHRHFEHPVPFRPGLLPLVLCSLIVQPAAQRMARRAGDCPAELRGDACGGNFPPPPPRRSHDRHRITRGRISTTTGMAGWLNCIYLPALWVSRCPPPPPPPIASRYVPYPLLARGPEPLQLIAIDSRCEGNLLRTRTSGPWRLSSASMNRAAAAVTRGVPCRASQSPAEQLHHPQFLRSNISDYKSVISSSPRAEGF